MIRDIEDRINTAGPYALYCIITLIQNTTLPPWALELIKLTVLNILAAALAGELGLGPVLSEVIKAL